MKRELPTTLTSLFLAIIITISIIVSLSAWAQKITIIQATKQLYKVIDYQFFKPTRAEYLQHDIKILLKSAKKHKEGHIKRYYYDMWYTLRSVSPTKFDISLHFPERYNPHMNMYFIKDDIKDLFQNSTKIEAEPHFHSVHIMDVNYSDIKYPRIKKL